MMPPLPDLMAALDAATERARTLVSDAGGADAAVLDAPAPGGRWSANQCLSHLTLTADCYDPIIGAAIADARRRGLVQRRPSRPDIVGRILAWTLEPPYRVRAKTIPTIDPTVTTHRTPAWPLFQQSQERQRARLAEADGLQLDAVRVASLFNARVRYNLLSYFLVTLAHERRHLWQAERALAGR